MHSYKLCEGVLKEQCTVKDDGKRVEVRRPKDIPSNSLQNLSDPDVTYSGHKGKGYQVQVMETYNTDEETRDKNLKLITYVHVEPAHESDAHALVPAIESSKHWGSAPEELLADKLQGGNENGQKAKKLGVELISPTKSAKENNGIPLSDFEMGEKGDVVSCPQGRVLVMDTVVKLRCMWINAEGAERPEAYGDG